MELKLYDTLTREKRVFAPLDPARVRMYVCGPTVYDFAHIGNARPVIVFDVLFRLLRHLYGADKVTYVRNITDVDDKINDRAASEYPDIPLNDAIRMVTEKTDRQFHEDVAALACLPPTFEPRATEFINRNDAPIDMVRLIERLVDSKHAYLAEGHVLFDVSSMPDYGKLSRRSLNDMMAGARVEIAPYKHNPMDFVLWKPSKPGEPAWPSPWGMGRPGWHIECSAMSAALLGKTFDIHGGGIDLVFPHHENEIAQSRCAFHTQFMANYWMHNGFLEINGKKMSKSEGNFLTIRELLQESRFGGRRWSGEVIRVGMLQTRYRDPIDWTVRSLEQSESRLAQWRSFAAARRTRRLRGSLSREILGLLYDDLDTPAALNLIDQVCKSERSSEEDRSTVNWALRLLGLRAERTPAAKLADAIGPVVSKISELSENDLSQLLRAARSSAPRFDERQVRFASFLASLDAIGELPRLLHNYRVADFSAEQINQFRNSPSFSQHFSQIHDLARSNLHSSVQTRTARQANNQKLRPLNRSRLAEKIQLTRLINALKTVRSTLSHLTVNEWSNFAATVQDRPFAANGEPRPETTLFVYLWLLSQLQEAIEEHQYDNPRFAKRLHRIILDLVPRSSNLEKNIQNLVDARNRARKQRNFAEADRIRDELAALGVVLKDSKDGTTWEVAR